MEKDILKLQQELDELRIKQEDAKEILREKIGDGSLDGKLEQLKMINEILREREKIIESLEMEIKRQKYIMANSQIKKGTIEAEK